MSQYIFSILIAIDKLGNAIAGGSHLNTISGRVGFFANVKNAALWPLYWAIIELLINWAFYPIDGTNHCYQAYLKEIKKCHSRDYQRGSDVALITLSILIAVVTPLIGLVLYPLMWVGIIKQGN